MINTRYDNLDFSQKVLNNNSLNYNEENNISFQDVFNTVQNNTYYNEKNNKKEDVSINHKDDYSNDSSVKEDKDVLPEDSYKNVENKSEEKLEKYLGNNIEENLDKKIEEKKNKLKSVEVDGKKEENIIDEEKLKLSKNKNKSLNLIDVKNLDDIDLKKLAENIDFLKEKVKNIKQNLKKEDEDEIKNILASIINLKNLIEESKTENAENKNEKFFIAKNNLKEDVKEKHSLQEAEKLLADISKKIKKLDDSVSSEMKEVKEAFAATIEKDFKNIEGNEKTEVKSKESKVRSDGRIDNVNDVSLSKDNVTELTVVKMKDDVSSLGDKLNSSFNSSGKTQNTSKTDVSETINKFQDMLTKLVDKAKIAVSEGRSEVVMTLKPEHLGDVRLKLIMEGDKLNAKIFVDNAEIKDIFTKNLDTVISSLNEIDINIEGFDVMLRQDNPQNQNNDDDFNMFERNINTNGVEGYDNNIENNNIVIDRYTFEEKKLNILI